MRKLILAMAAAVAMALPGAAWATNGMNMIGTGAISSGMGGADAAVPAGCTAIAGNPAQLASSCSRIISVGSAFLMPVMDVTLPGSSEVGNEDQTFLLPFVGYAQRVGNSPVSLGLGVFAQGGMGVDFRDIPLGPGVSDSLYSQVAFMRMAPTVAYNVNADLTVGASLYIGYATIDYDYFPNQLQGQTVTGLSSYTYAGRVGFSYRLNEKWSIGATYTSESALDFENGEMNFNFGPGLGAVTYKDVTMDNFTWPQQVEMGVAYRPTPKWLLAFDISWVNWASAIETVTVKAKNPTANLPAAYQELDIPFVMEWEDQWVFALGAQYEINESWYVRGGYNYGASPVPDQNLNPLFPAIVEHHLTLGFTYTTGVWDFDVAFEHAFSNSQTNDGAYSATNPFAGTEVSHYQNTVHLMFSYRF